MNKIWRKLRKQKSGVIKASPDPEMSIPLIVDPPLKAPSIAATNQSNTENTPQRKQTRKTIKEAVTFGLKGFSVHFLDL